MIKKILKLFKPKLVSKTKCPYNSEIECFAGPRCDGCIEESKAIQREG